MLDKFQHRRYVLYGLIALLFSVFTIRLFYLQVLDDTGRVKSEGNVLYRQTVYPARGRIYDRQHQLLVDNELVYDVNIVLSELDSTFDTTSFCFLCGIEKEDFIDGIGKIRKDVRLNRHVPQTLLAQQSREEVAPLQEALYKFPCVYLARRTKRNYPHPCAAHIIGSVAEVSQQEMDADKYYSLGDYIGKSGVEKYYEAVLRGEKGVNYFMRDAAGRIQGSFKAGTKDLKAQVGESVTMTLDVRLQELCEAMMSNKVGSIVALQPQTGEVLALVSAPAWNPQSLVSEGHVSTYYDLLNDPNRPLLNRAIQAQYSPGSTFKTLAALIYLHDRTITRYKHYPCAGPLATPIRCTHYHHAEPNVLEALEQSCNPFFWQCYRDYLYKRDDLTGARDISGRFRTWTDYLRDMGLGHTFAKSDILSQAKGYVPSVELYNKMYGERRWNPFTISSLSIGQGELLITPLQLANLVATIANEGYYIEPHIVKSVGSNGEVSTETHYCKLDNSAGEYGVVKEAMRRVMVNGTGRYYDMPYLKLCGKTGTVENQHGKDHSVFMCYAPQQNPQIAIAVVIENAGFGATWACPIASLAAEQFIRGRIDRPELLDRVCKTSLLPEL